MKIATLNGASLSDRAGVFKSYLDSLPSDEIVFTGEMEAATGRTFRSGVKLPQEYCLKIRDAKGVRMVFGNPRAIKSLEKKLSNENRTRG